MWKAFWRAPTKRSSGRNPGHRSTDRRPHRQHEMVATLRSAQRRHPELRRSDRHQGRGRASRSKSLPRSKSRSSSPQPRTSTPTTITCKLVSMRMNTSYTPRLDSIEQGKRLLSHAISLDKNFADAYALLASSMGIKLQTSPRTAQQMSSGRRMLPRTLCGSTPSRRKD